MPYIPEADRPRFTPASESTPHRVGELTFQLQQVVLRYLLDAAEQEGMRYKHLAEVLGALEGCKADFIERVVTQYENHRNHENGDVWRELEEFIK